MKSMSDRAMAEELAGRVSEKGGRAYYVGGYVRDLARGETCKDIDIEVHGLLPAQLEEILDSLGGRLSMGESFGIYSLKGYGLDIAMPRKETNRGKGHRDFDIFVDPFIGTQKAARRRDFTINSLMQDILTGELTDHFGGLDDLKNRIIRHVDAETFAEDPLRVLRAAQFAARFGFSVADETLTLCRSMELSELSRERILGELSKALLKSNTPSVFFELLREMGQLDVWFLELKQLIGVEQSPRHHAEGDAWRHTMMVLDESAGLKGELKNPLGFMLSAVTHDFGKALCTELKNGELHAYKHEQLGLPLVESFMRRLTSERQLIKYVLNMTQLHMLPNILASAGSSVKATNRMFDASCDPEALLCLARADRLGKLPREEGGACEAFLGERLERYREYMSRPFVMGRDLVAAGVTPSVRFPQYLSLAHKLRLAGVDRESALRQTLALARKEGDYSGESECK